MPAQGQSITVRLIPEAILFGTITDQNGQPIQDLHIQLTMLRVENGLRRWRQVQATTTNVEGQFRFAELQAGQYSLATSFHIEGLAEAPSSVAFMPVTFPPLTGDGIRGALTLMPGEHVEANASPAMEKLYPVTGMINGMAGQGAGFDGRNQRRRTRRLTRQHVSRRWVPVEAAHRLLSAQSAFRCGT